MNDKNHDAREARTAFAELIRGYCRLHKLDDAGGILAGKPIEIDGVPFSLVHDEDVQPGTLFLYTGYGSVPGERAAAAHAALLEVNLFLHRIGGAATFALAPGRNEVVLAEYFPLAGLTPELLDALLGDAVRNALSWRATHFLDKEQAQAQVRARSDLGAAMRERLLGKGKRP